MTHLDHHHSHDHEHEHPEELLDELTPSLFVGREQELNQLESLLRQEKLVVIQGSSGIGKKSLASQLASTWEEAEFVDVILSVKPLDLAKHPLTPIQQ